MFRIVIFVLIVSCVFGLYYWYGFSKSKDYQDIKVLSVRDQKLKVVIADTHSEQSKGLSGREKLKENQGMFFVFDNYKRRYFWMKGMLIPIDIIWIKDDEIIGVEKNVQIPQNKIKVLKMYRSPEPINHVLEVNAGFFDKYKLQIGDKIKIPL